VKIVSVVGARPQFIKAAAVSRVLRERHEEVLIHTGQHYDYEMSGIFFDGLEIPPPDANLEVGSGGHGAQTGAMLKAIENVLIAERPDYTLIYGDTNSTLAGALAASKLCIPVAHVEAGLRSFNRRMPEEINRVLTDHLSTLLLCPTETGVVNLQREGIIDGVHNIGDVMYDAACFAAAASGRSRILDRLGLVERSYAVATVHRAESTESKAALAEIVEFLRRQARDRIIVFPLHPRTRKRIAEWRLDLGDILACEPFGYLDMHRLLRSSVAVFTDSGGLQKEAYFHKVPCVTLRSETEWVETINAGWNRLWKGPDYAPRREISAFGDGHAADRAVELLINFLKCQPRAGSAPSF